MDAAKKRKAAAGAVLRKSRAATRANSATTRARAAADAATADAAVATKKRRRARVRCEEDDAREEDSTCHGEEGDGSDEEGGCSAGGEEEEDAREESDAVKRTTRVAASVDAGGGEAAAELEQKERVESRIQSLHRDAKPTAAALAAAACPNWRWSLQQVHNTTTSAREFQAIKAISFLPNDLKQVLLRGQLVPSNKTEQVPKKPAPSSSLLSPRLLKYLQRHYNESQMQAIFGCLGEDSRVIIQGPPGTAREASESKKNRKKMRKYAREVEEVLLESLVTKHRSTFPTVKQARQAIIKNAQIVFCTLSGAGSVAMCEFAQDFDALIIDEAAQAVEASTLIPFKFRPHRVVLVGDHRQLPATVISKKLVSMGYDRSLQQRLVENKSPVLLLTQQYRMHPEIAEFPSTYFYGGRLVQDGNMSNWTAQDYHRDRAFQPLLFLDVQGTQSQVSGSTSLRNMSEVETVVQLIRRLLKKFPHIEWKKRIGVIAPYKQQIYEPWWSQEEEEKKPRQRGGGRPRRLLADERRMNVAITRAKSSLWIVGNSNLLEQSRAWRTLIQHTKDHSRYIGDSAASLFAPSSSTRKTSKAPSK
ncbi:helicase sen1 [Phytophthora cinnamomi]|uniref:helicase sen1 n=1 Tax=Phytophthora cinnamomi TaxID=4785 RepID=UPI00355AB533|nr:helicase sen1 [Phytophthora cinnamomi]